MKRIIKLMGCRFEVKSFADGSYRVAGPLRTVDLTDFNGACGEIGWQIQGGEDGGLRMYGFCRQAMMAAGY